MSSDLRYTEEDAVLACFKVHCICVECRESMMDLFQGSSYSGLHECRGCLLSARCHRTLQAFAVLMALPVGCFYPLLLKIIARLGRGTGKFISRGVSSILYGT